MTASRFGRWRRPAGVLLAVVLAASACDAGGTAAEPRTPDPAAVVEATSQVEGLTFAAETTVAGTVFISATGVFDPGTGVGHREDLLVDGNGELSPAAEVWVVDGVLRQREVGDQDVTEINGSTGGFLLLDGARDAGTLRDALEAAIAGRPWRAVGVEELADGSPVTRIEVVDEDDEPSVQLLVDDDDVLRELRVPEAGRSPETVTVLRLTPGPVTVPPPPDG